MYYLYFIFLCFQSKSLPKREIEYGQIDKEFKAVLFACKIFHNYFYGSYGTDRSFAIDFINE